eukprot:TRINITY_DN14354_c0_g1_i1.p1 TRINITY_DN14354_c0_g1~~TRINITY_DN14354_c0_g1_i1.p1  ORF type:complete len:858 (+),score=172.19 TRINITY_DN14354_c0_g1_i1:54-2627(+)
MGRKKVPTKNGKSISGQKARQPPEVEEFVDTNTLLVIVLNDDLSIMESRVDKTSDSLWNTVKSTFIEMIPPEATSPHLISRAVARRTSNTTVFTSFMKYAVDRCIKLPIKKVFDVSKRYTGGWDLKQIHDLLIPDDWSSFLIHLRMCTYGRVDYRQFKFDVETTAFLLKHFTLWGVEYNTYGWLDSCFRDRHYLKQHGLEHSVCLHILKISKDDHSEMRWRGCLVQDEPFKRYVLPSAEWTSKEDCLMVARSVFPLTQYLFDGRKEMIPWLMSIIPQEESDFGELVSELVATAKISDGEVKELLCLRYRLVQEQAPEKLVEFFQVVYRMKDVDFFIDFLNRELTSEDDFLNSIPAISSICKNEHSSTHVKKWFGDQMREVWITLETDMEGHLLRHQLKHSDLLDTALSSLPSGVLDTHGRKALDVVLQTFGDCCAQPLCTLLRSSQGIKEWGNDGLMEALLEFAKYCPDSIEGITAAGVIAVNMFQHHLEKVEITAAREVINTLIPKSNSFEINILLSKGKYEWIKRRCPAQWVDILAGFEGSERLKSELIGIAQAGTLLLSDLEQLNRELPYLTDSYRKWVTQHKAIQEYEDAFCSFANETQIEQPSKLPDLKKLVITEQEQRASTQICKWEGHNGEKLSDLYAEYSRLKQVTCLCQVMHKEANKTTNDYVLIVPDYEDWITSYVINMKECGFTTLQRLQSAEVTFSEVSDLLGSQSVDNVFNQLTTIATLVKGKVSISMKEVKNTCATSSKITRCLEASKAILILKDSIAKLSRQKLTTKNMEAFCDGSKSDHSNSRLSDLEDKRQAALQEIPHLDQIDVELFNRFKVDCNERGSAPGWQVRVTEASLQTLSSGC